MSQRDSCGIPEGVRLVAIVLVLLVAETAAAQVTSEDPVELQVYDETDAAGRRARLDAAIGQTANLLHRANLLLARADDDAARGVHYRRLADDLLVQIRPARGSERQDLFQRRTQLHVDERAAYRSALWDYFRVFCGVDRLEMFKTTCPAPRELRGWKHADAAMYRFAWVLRRDARADDAVRVYRRLVEQHPKSRHAIDAHVELAEHYVRRREWTQALVEYEAIARTDAPLMYRSFAAYRRGWVELQLERTQDALASFKAALAMEPRGRSADAARMQLVIAYSDSGARNEVYDTFSRVSSNPLEMMQQLAMRWMSLKTPEAISLLREMLQRAPHDSRACFWQETILSRTNRDDRVQFLVEVERMIDVFYRAQFLGLEPFELARCRNIVHTYTLQMARFFAAKGQGRTEDDLLLAARLYDLFLLRFPDDPQAALARTERKKLEPKS